MYWYCNEKLAYNNISGLKGEKLNRILALRIINLAAHVIVKYK